MEELKRWRGGMNTPVECGSKKNSQDGYIEEGRSLKQIPPRSASTDSISLYLSVTIRCDIICVPKIDTNSVDCMKSTVGYMKRIE